MAAAKIAQAAAKIFGQNENDLSSPAATMLSALQTGPAAAEQSYSLLALLPAIPAADDASFIQVQRQQYL